MCVFEIWLRVCCLGCWDSAEGLGFRVCGFDSEFLVWGFLIWRSIRHLGYWYLSLGFGLWVLGFGLGFGFKVLGFG